MLRYARLYACFVRFSFSRAMEFRMDFFFRIGMDALWYFVNLAFFWVLYRHTASLGGWGYDQVLVFVGGVFFVDALHMTIFSNNLWWLPITINKGDLDYYLVRPVSSLFFLSLRDFAANSFVNLFMALGVLAWTLAHFPEPLGALPVTLYIAMLFLGLFLYYVLHMLFLIPSFWMHTGGGLREIFYALEPYATRPHGVFRGWVRRILVSLLPFALIMSFPAQALLEDLALPVLAHMAGATAAAFLLMLWLWRRGLRAYVSASS
ncbi:MAG: ABC-2 family transporter protein [Planctomycetes bacterium]|nr:ABC-2 family transporter protein [Planctomycetota bacterium]